MRMGRIQRKQTCRDPALLMYDTDSYRAVSVVDRYRWLENDAADEVKHWAEDQRTYTRGVLDKLP